MTTETENVHADETPALTTDQDAARMLLRRLMAERALRTTPASKVLGVETHTLRRMLNGSRAITLQEMITICRLGGYSLDDIFLSGKTSGGPATVRSKSSAGTEESLGRVFSAIAELLTGQSVSVGRPEQLPDYAAPPTKERRPYGSRKAETPAEPGEPGAKRGRGRPRKNFGPDGLPGPQW
jgi:hypothetical protein